MPRSRKKPSNGGLLGCQRLLIFLLLILVGVNSSASADPFPDSERAGESSAGLSGDYPLGVGDFIRIVVHGEPDLGVETRLENNGVISYPLLGEIRVLGLTTTQLERKITEQLRGDYLVNPDVQVTVFEYRHFYINGEVTRPGGYPYIPGLTVQKAAALAGGFTDRASTRKIYVMRENDANQQKVQISLDAEIYPGDTVIIEEGLF